MSFALAMSLGLLALLLAAAAAWYSRRDARLRRRAIADAGVRMAERASRQDFPHRYVGLDSAYGLKCETPCRIVGHVTGNCVRVRTPDGRAWIVRDAQVARRERAT